LPTPHVHHTHSTIPRQHSRHSYQRRPSSINFDQNPSYLVRADSSLPSSKTVPTVQGTESFTNWQRAITSYLVRKGAHKTLEGTEVEPFRTPGAYLPGTRAGNHQPDATQSTTAAVFTAAQRLLWAEWSIREHEARLTVILTVSHGIRAEIECMWSANDMNRHISSTHKVDTTSHQADLSARISPLRLPLKASREKMLEHYKSCSFLSAEAVSFGCTHRRLGEV